MFFTTKQHQCEYMNLLKEQLNGTTEIKQKQNFNSQLFIVSTVEAETMSNTVRKFNELHKFMNFLWESFHWQRQLQKFSKFLN